MVFQDLVLYYMSGTGNSYRAAIWMGQVAGQKGANVLVRSIEEARPEGEVGDSEESLLGLIMPTHAFTAPWYMIRFAYRLPRRKSTQAFCVATRGSLKFGPLFTPGISGSGTFLIALILALKGYHVRGILGLDMPSNWISLHSGLKESSARAIIARGESWTIHFMETILAGGKHWITLNSICEIIWGILLLPISALYLAIGRFYLAKLFFANNSCNGCGICAENCPVGAIKMWGKPRSLPFWKYNCESCMRCMAFCPTQAIEAGHSWAVILYYITALPISTWLLGWLEGYSPGIASLSGVWTDKIIYLLYVYPAMFISYYGFILLNRIHAVNWFFTHTTLTHLYRRYHEPGTKVKDIAASK